LSPLSERQTRIAEQQAKIMEGRNERAAIWEYLPKLPVTFVQIVEE